MGHTERLVNVTITFRNIQGTDAIKNYAHEKISNCLQKFVHKDTEAHLVLIVEKNRQRAEISFRADGADINAEQESADLYSAIDGLVDTVTTQLRKHKEKMTKHH